MFFRHLVRIFWVFWIKLCYVCWCSFTAWGNPTQIPLNRSIWQNLYCVWHWSTRQFYRRQSFFSYMVRYLWWQASKLNKSNKSVLLKVLFWMISSNCSCSLCLENFFTFLVFCFFFDQKKLFPLLLLFKNFISTVALIIGPCLPFNSRDVFSCFLYFYW